MSAEIDGDKGIGGDRKITQLPETIATKPVTTKSVVGNESHTASSVSTPSITDLVRKLDMLKLERDRVALWREEVAQRAREAQQRSIDQYEDARVLMVRARMAKIAWEGHSESEIKARDQLALLQQKIAEAEKEQRASSSVGSPTATRPSSAFLDQQKK